MPLTPYQPFQPYKPVAPKQPAQQTPVNRNWATGQTAWDPKGLFGTSQQTGVTQQPAQTWNMTMGAGPTAGMMQDPTPGNTDVASAMPNPWAMSNTFQDKPAQSQDVASAMPDPWTNNQPAPQWNEPAYVQQQDPGAFNTQYGTFDNLQAYMNPFLDQTIERGNQAIQSSAAARGLLGSSATLNNIGDWTAQAQQRAFTDARDAFNFDRGYMTDNYRDNRNNNQGEYWKTNAWNYGLFGDEKADYDTRMKDWYNQMNGITQTGIGATDKTGALYAALGDALSGLYGEQGNTSASGIMGGSNANRGLIGNILGMFLGGG